MREYSLEETSELLKIHKGEIKAIMQRLERWFRNPNIIDSEQSLIATYIKAYKKHGPEYARNAVYKRIQLAKEVKRARELLDEN